MQSNVKQPEIMHRLYLRYWDGDSIILFLNLCFYEIEFGLFHTMSMTMVAAD